MMEMCSFITVGNGGSGKGVQSSVSAWVGEKGSCYEAAEYIIRILRHSSSRQHPMTVKQISTESGFLLSEKRIRSILKGYMDLQDGCKGDMFCYHNQGKLKVVGKEKGKKYYWEDIMTEEEKECLKRTLT